MKMPVTVLLQQPRLVSSNYLFSERLFMLRYNSMYLYTDDCMNICLRLADDARLS